jgi:hypothetical protein
MKPSSYKLMHVPKFPNSVLRQCDIARPDPRHSWARIILLGVGKGIETSTNKTGPLRLEHENVRDSIHFYRTRSPAGPAGGILSEVPLIYS